MKTLQPIRLPYVEVTEDLLGCGTLDGFWEKVKFWAGTVTEAASMEVAFIQIDPSTGPGRILYYTGVPEEATPARLALMCAAAGEAGRSRATRAASGTLVSRSFEILPDVSCVVLACFETEGGPADETGGDFQRLLKFSFTLLRHSPLMECLRHVCQRMAQENQTPCVAALGPGIFKLTRRECEVLHWIDAVKQDAEIATILDMNVRTVQTHVRSLLRKLACENRLQLMTLRLAPVLGIPAPPA